MSKISVLLLLISCISEVLSSTTYKNIGAGLTSVPTNIPTGSKGVELTTNALTSISATDFSHLSALSRLYLDHNNITSISADAFNNNLKLSRLYLSYNPIKTVPFFSALADVLILLHMIDCEISNATWDQEIHYPKLSSLYLEHNQLTDVPDLTKASATLRQLRMSYNRIEVLNTSKLNICTRLSSIRFDNNNMKLISGQLKLGSLSTLYLGNNLLVHFPNISEMTKIGALRIENNRFKSIPNNSFDNNNRLYNLWLFGNRLNHMPDLDGLKNSLWYLELYENTNITSIPDDFFNGFAKIIWVNLNGTSVTSLSFAKHFGPSLKYLYINKTQITTVPAGTFRNVTGLQRLHMAEGPITFFEMSNIQNMPNLKELYLHDNSLTKIGNAYTYCNGAACTNLKIDLSNNPIPCDKRICWAKLNTTITVVMNDCTGKQWSNVTVDDLACLKGKCPFSFIFVGLH